MIFVCKAQSRKSAYNDHVTFLIKCVEISFRPIELVRQNSTKNLIMVNNKINEKTQNEDNGIMNKKQSA